MDMVAEMKNDTRLMEWSGIEDQDTVISLNAFTPQTNQSRKPLSHRRHWHIRSCRTKLSLSFPTER